MDTIKQLTLLAGKYKYVAAVVLLGLALMLLPGKDSSEAVTPRPETVQTVTMQDSLEQILAQIQGVGRVRVLLTEAQGRKTLYVYDESKTPDTEKSDAVIITDSSRAQSGMVSQVIPPVYQGAVVVCQGGDSPGVRLAVVEAVSSATGLSADKISVLKMK